MDDITYGQVSPQTREEPSSPLSPKQPRSDYTLTDGVKSRLDTREILTFWKQADNPLSSTALLEDANQVIILGECGHEHDEKQHEDSQGTKLNIDPDANLSHSDDPQTGSSEVCLITSEQQLLHVCIKEQVSVTETGRLSSTLVHDRSGTLTKSLSLKDTSRDTSSQPDCNRLGKSIENEPPSGYSLPTADDEDRRQVQNSISQMQAVTLSSSGEDVRCQFDCRCAVVLTDERCGTWNQSVGAEESTQREIQYEFSEKTLFNKGKEEVRNGLAFSDFANCKSFHSKPGEYPSGNLAECEKTGGKTFELQICENENVAFCYGETKGQVNEDGIGKNLIPSPAECAEGSVGSNAVVLARSTETESIASEVDDCKAKEEQAAGKMIAKIGSEMADHTTEIPMPARISQEPAEGDNDAGSFSVIDPAIWSETDGEAEECCNSASTAAGVELSPSVKVCKMEPPLSFWTDVGPSHFCANELSDPDWIGQSSNQSRVQQRRNEKADLCPSYTERQTFITADKMHDKPGNESCCHWKSSPSSSPHMLLPAGDERKESHGAVGHELKEQDQCKSSGHVKTQGVACSNRRITQTDMKTEIEEKENTFAYETALQSKEKLLQEKEKHQDTTEMTIGHCITECTVSEISECSDKLTITEDEEMLKVLCDHHYTSDMSIMEWTDEGMDKKTLKRVAEELETYDREKASKGDLEQRCKTDLAEISVGDCPENQTAGNKLSSGGEDEAVAELWCLSTCQHTSEIFMAENEDDHLTCLASKDAAVPSPPHDLVPTFHSQNTDNNSTARNCTDRFSSVPSAFAFCNIEPRGVDTFEKIQLTPDDEEEDDPAGLSSGPLFTSLPGQLLKTQERELYHSMPGLESVELSDRAEEGKEEEGHKEVDRYESRTDNIGNGFLNSDGSCNEVPNFISAADVIASGLPEQRPPCQSTCDAYEYLQEELHLQTSATSTKSDSPTSDLNDSPEFEMKDQFNLVLKELNLFFDISTCDVTSSSIASTPERHLGALIEALEGNASNCREQCSSPTRGAQRETSSEDADEDHSLEMCGGDLVVSCTFGSCDEQEVPLSGLVCPEEKGTEPTKMERKEGMWSPCFVSLPFLEQLSHTGPLEQPRRLEPLRTCTRPIRVGLSRRAKTKHLHRPHPYK